MNFFGTQDFGGGGAPSAQWRRAILSLGAMPPQTKIRPPQNRRSGGGSLGKKWEGERREGVKGGGDQRSIWVRPPKLGSFAAIASANPPPPPSDTPASRTLHLVLAFPPITFTTHRFPMPGTGDAFLANGDLDAVIYKETGEELARVERPWNQGDGRVWIRQSWAIKCCIEERRGGCGGVDFLLEVVPGLDSTGSLYWTSFREPKSIFIRSLMLHWS